MAETTDPVRITLRVPGGWAHQGELIERMPEGYRLTPNAMILPNGTQLEFIPMPPDGQFAQVFKSSFRRPATNDELATVSRYSVNIGLSGPGGSQQAALLMMQAAAAVIQAGGAGVFIDNCALAHGGANWLEMTEDGSSDSLSYAFVSMARSDHEIRTLGMHALGYPEIVLPRTDDDEADAATMVELVRSVCSDNHCIRDGELISNERGLRFRASATSNDDRTVGTPMHNPFGRLKLTSVKSIAEQN